MIATLKPKKNKAFTLTETAIVLGLTAIVLGGVWLATSKVNQNQKKADVLQTMLQIADNARNLYQNSTLGTAPSLSQQITAGIYPASVVNGSATLNPWGGSYSINFTIASGRFTAIQVNTTFPSSLGAARLREICAGTVSDMQGLIDGQPGSPTNIYLNCSAANDVTTFSPSSLMPSLAAGCTNICLQFDM